MPDSAQLVGLTIKIGLVAMMVAFGLRAQWSDATYLFRHPVLLAKAIVARNVAMPLVAAAIISVFRLETVVAKVLLALSVTAVPPLLPAKQSKAGGRQEYNVGLLFAESVLAIVIIPVTLELVNQMVGTQARFSPRQVATIVGQLIIIPLGLGMLIGRLAPERKERLARIGQRIALVLIVLPALAILGLSWKPMMTLVGNGTLIAMAVYTAIGLLVGHLLGGPRYEDRKSLAIASASSHPGLALGVIATNATAEPRIAMAAIVLYLIVNALVTKPYSSYRQSHQSHRLSRSGPERRRRVRVGSDRRSHVT